MRVSPDKEVKVEVKTERKLFGPITGVSRKKGLEAATTGVSRKKGSTRN